MMKEQILQFGHNNHLVGIYTSSGLSEGDKPVAIILNSGVMHRAGTCRISVKIARQLARDGICSLRFDFSGIGDSLSSQDEVDIESRNIVEIKQAMNYIENKYAQNKFVIYGLCSGARDAFSAAMEDERIVGIAQIDGHAYRNMRHYLKHYLPRLVRFRNWSNFVFRRAPRAISNIFKTTNQEADEDMLVQVWPDYPPRKQIENGYKLLAERGVRFYIVFTGSWAEEYNYKNQFFDMYSGVSFGSLVKLEYMPHASHILTDEKDQNRVTDGFKEWMLSLH
jgi:alpha/beta superfamily hydrolase